MFAWLKALFGGGHSKKTNGQAGPAVPVQCLEQAPESLEIQDLVMEAAAQEAEEKMREVARSSTQTLNLLQIDAKELQRQLKELPPLSPAIKRRLS